MFKIQEIHGVANVLPILAAVNSASIIARYNADGTTSKPTEEDNAVIAKMLEYNLDVYAVVESKYIIEGRPVIMVNYLLIPTDAVIAIDRENYEPNDFIGINVDSSFAYVTCYCVNKTWGIEEMGDIAIKEANGVIVRIQ